MARREYGSGTIYQRKDGLWIGSVSDGWTERGTRRRRSVTGRTETEARGKLKKLIAQIETGTVTASPRATVKSWRDEWLPIVQTTAAPAYYSTTASQLRLWIIPTIGHIRLASLTPAHVRQVTTAIRDAGRTTTTAARVQATLMRMLRAAIREGHTVPDAVMLTRSPGQAIHDRLAPDSEQARAILATLETRPDRARWILAMLTGIRQAEALGLTWEHVDLDALSIDIQWQLKPLPHIDKRSRRAGYRVPDNFEAHQLHGALHLVRPKSIKSRRTIPITEDLAGVLRDWQAKAPANPWGLTFPQLRPDTTEEVRALPGLPEADRRAWREVQTLAAVRHPSGRFYHVHEARNLAATLLKDAPEVVQVAILGHMDHRTTLGYQRAEIAAGRAAMEQAQRGLLGG